MLFTDKELLVNPYSVLRVSPKQLSKQRNQQADDFYQWLVGPKGQQIIRQYRLANQAVFFVN